MISLGAITLIFLLMLFFECDDDQLHYLVILSLIFTIIFLLITIKNMIVKFKLRLFQKTLYLTGFCMLMSFITYSLSINYMYELIKSKTLIFISGVALALAFLLGLVYNNYKIANKQVDELKVHSSKSIKKLSLIGGLATVFIVNMVIPYMTKVQVHLAYLITFYIISLVLSLGASIGIIRCYYIKKYNL